MRTLSTPETAGISAENGVSFAVNKAVIENKPPRSRRLETPYPRRRGALSPAAATFSPGAATARKRSPHQHAPSTNS